MGAILELCGKTVGKIGSIGEVIERVDPNIISRVLEVGFRKLRPGNMG
jgi:hypothetical protein